MYGTHARFNSETITPTTIRGGIGLGAAHADNIVSTRLTENDKNSITNTKNREGRAPGVIDGRQGRIQNLNLGGAN